MNEALSIFARLKGTTLWKYEKIGQVPVTPVPLSGGCSNLWYSGWDSKDLAGRPEQNPADTSRPGQQSGI